MKDKLLKVSGIAVLASAIFMVPGASFFEFMVHYGKQKRQFRKQWVQLSHIKKNHPRNKYEKKYEEGKEWCQQQSMQDCFIRSKDGLLLHAYYLPAENAKRIVLLSHGYRASTFSDFANIARFLHENQCNLLFIDQRCCGASQGEYITFGALEQYDVQRWAYYLSKRNKEKLPIYFLGQSLGAATVLMASGQKLPSDVKGIIADCGFCSMKGQVQDMARNWFHLKWIGLLLFRLDLFCRLLAGFRMKDADTAEAMKKNKRPVLFFHGSGDTYVYPENSKKNYELCQADKELVMIEGAVHISSAYEDEELYRKKLLEFFERTK